MLILSPILLVSSAITFIASIYFLCDAIFTENSLMLGRTIFLETGEFLS